MRYSVICPGYVLGMLYDNRHLPEVLRFSPHGVLLNFNKTHVAPNATPSAA